jgi:hypothetical protein
MRDRNEWFKEANDAIERIGTLRDLLQAEVKAEKGGDE